jgi:thymidylate synthase (FAD)
MEKFRVEVIQATQLPQQVIYAAMHQDYSEEFVWDMSQFPNEEKCGEIIVKQLLAGERGHYGPLEHPQITFACGYFPHSVMQQARTHRVGTSFDVQSFRYTGNQVAEVAVGKRDVEDVFYLRPVGKYSDRQGKKYFYSPEQRQKDLDWCLEAAKHYKDDFEGGMAEEHARGKLPFDYRQHFIVSFNVRSLMHFLDLRGKRDAQLEIQKLCELMVPHFDTWVPAVSAWYKSTRLGKARLAP